MVDAEAPRAARSDDTSSSDGTDGSVAKREPSNVSKRVCTHTKNALWRVLSDPCLYARMTTDIAVLCIVLFILVRSYVQNAKQHI